MINTFVLIVSMRSITQYNKGYEGIYGIHDLEKKEKETVFCYFPYKTCREPPMAHIAANVLKSGNVSVRIRKAFGTDLNSIFIPFDLIIRLNSVEKSVIR
jgi:hypothetical protein